jgi:hypothetical protein
MQQHTADGLRCSTASWLRAMPVKHVGIVSKHELIAPPASHPVICSALHHLSRRVAFHEEQQVFAAEPKMPVFVTVGVG